MKKIFIVFLCVCYTIVSFGITFQIHRCADNVLWAISNEKALHDTCPLCHHTPQSRDEIKKDCQGGNCEDMELKLDQLSHKVFSFTKDNTPSLNPAILTIPWMQDIFSFLSFSKEWTSSTHVFAFANSSPPIYLYNCIFRI